MKPRTRWAEALQKMQMPIEKLRRLLAACNPIRLLGVALDDRTVASTFEPDRQLVVQYRQDPAASNPAMVSLTGHSKADA